MKVRRRIVVFDAADIETESRFWADLLGGEVRRDDEWHSVVVDGEWIIGVQQARRLRQPGRPPLLPGFTLTYAGIGRRSPASSGQAARPFSTSVI